MSHVFLDLFRHHQIHIRYEPTCAAVYNNNNNNIHRVSKKCLQAAAVEGKRSEKL